MLTGSEDRASAFNQLHQLNAFNIKEYVTIMNFLSLLIITEKYLLITLLIIIQVNTRLGLECWAVKFN